MREETAGLILDGEKDHSFCLLSIPARFREECSPAGSFAVKAFLPESGVNWSFPAGVIPVGEMPLYCVKCCESSLYTLVEDWEVRFASLWVSVSYPLRESSRKESGRSHENYRQVLSFPGRSLCARLCVYRL